MKEKEKPTLAELIAKYKEEVTLNNYPSGETLMGIKEAAEDLGMKVILEIDPAGRFIDIHIVPSQQEEKDKGQNQG